MTAIAGNNSLVFNILKKAKITPRGVQTKAIEEGVLEGVSVMVSSPTGSGKTLVGEMALISGVERGRKGLYLVPLRALAAQVASVLTDRCGEHQVKVALSTGDYYRPDEGLGDVDILVTTYERVDSLLRHGAGWMEDVGVVVVDEVQNIAEGTRGARLESVLVRLRRMIEDIQVVALSATVGTPDALSDWLGCTLIQSDDRPVPLSCRVLVTTGRETSVRELVMTTVQRNGQAIVFTRTRGEAEAEAKRLSPVVGRQIMEGEKEEIDRTFEGLQYYDTDVPAVLKPLLRNGVAYHHAGLGAKVRRLIEELFNEGKIRVICATTTLASGMDLPARTVILTTVSSPSDYSLMLSANRVHQMLGRAGRPGRDKVGFGIILTRSRGEADEVRRRYFRQKQDEKSGKSILVPEFDDVGSAIDRPWELADHLLVALDFLGEASLDTVKESFFEHSYHHFYTNKDEGGPHRVVELGEVKTEETLEKHSDSETLRNARDKAIGSAEVRESGPGVIGGMAMELRGPTLTCRFSARPSSTTGAVEGPQCSCGKPINRRGILCSHLLNLGFAAIEADKALADYVIPLALSESSPSRTLVRLELIEGTTENKFRVTRMGKTVNRLYLRVQTFREMRAVMSTVEDNIGLLWLLRHLLSVESGRVVDKTFDSIIGNVVTRSDPLEAIAGQFEMATGDLLALLDTSHWLLYCISAIARVGNLVDLANRASSLQKRINARIGKEEIKHD